MKLKLTAISAMVLLSACAQLNSGIQGFNQSLKSFDNGLAKSTAGMQTAYMSPEQAAQINKQSQITIDNHQINSAVHEAMPTIVDLTKIEACLFDEQKWNHMTNRFMAPDLSALSMNHISEYTFKYHDKSTCVTLIRMQGWSMPALNALEYEAVYVANDSGESQKVEHLMVRQPDGTWLYKR